MVSGWTHCSEQPGPPYGHPDGYPDGGRSYNSIPCYGRNLMFIIIGFVVQPENLILPLLQPDIVAEQQEWATGAQAQTRNEAERKVESERFRADLYRGGRGRLTSGLNIPSDRRAHAHQHVRRQNRRRRRRRQERNLFADRRERTQSSQPSASLHSSRRQKGRKLMRQSLREMEVGLVDSESSPTFDGYIPQRAAPIEIPRRIEENGAEGDWDGPATAFSLPTPRTLRLLSDEHALRKMFGNDGVSAREFSIGQRVEAQYLSFHDFYPGCVVGKETRHNSGSLYTILYDDDTVEKGVPNLPGYLGRLKHVW